MNATHDVFNQSTPLVDTNLFEANLPLQQALQRLHPGFDRARFQCAGRRSRQRRDADPRAAGQLPRPEAARARPLRPPHRPGRVPPQLPRADGKRVAPQAARHAVDRRAGRAHRACGRLHALHRARAVDPVPGVDDLRGRAGTAPPAAALRRLVAQAGRHEVRPALPALRAEVGRDHGHGHDREAGRLRRARQHHARGVRRRRRLGPALPPHRPQVVHVGADVRCLPDPGADGQRPELLLHAAAAARRQRQSRCRSSG